MTDGMYIDEASLKNLKINIKAFKAEVLRNAVSGLVSFGMRIIGQAQRNLEGNDSIAFGKLRNSRRWFIREDNTVDVGFYCAYAAYVEEGRGPGKRPPMDLIYAWLEKKEITATERKAVKKEIDKAEKTNRTIVKRNKRKRNKRKRKNMTKEERLRWQLAYLISRSIGEKGTTPHPYFRPAYEQYRLKITQFMQGHINAAIEKYKKK